MLTLIYASGDQDKSSQGSVNKHYEKNNYLLEKWKNREIVAEILTHPDNVYQHKLKYSTSFLTKYLSFNID